MTVMKSPNDLVKRPVLAGRITFPIKRMAAAMSVTEDQMKRGMADGRGAFPFSEHWGIFYIRHLERIGKPVEGGQKGINTFALTNNGVNFMMSKDVGSKRGGDLSSLIESINQTRVIMVVDIRSFPDVVFIPVRPEDLVDTVRAGGLGVHGWAANSFYKWMRSRYAFVTKKVPLTRLKEIVKIYEVAEKVALKEKAAS